jgi:hypothetical protein
MQLTTNAPEQDSPIALSLDKLRRREAAIKTTCSKVNPR